MQAILEICIYSAVWALVILLVMALRSRFDMPEGSSVGAILLATAFGVMTWAALLTLDVFFA